MLKLFGCLLILSVGVAAGFYASNSLLERHKRLCALHIALGEIADMMRAGLDIGSIFQKENIKTLFQADGYTVTVKSEWLTRDDVALLNEYLKTLGMGDIETQIERTKAYRELLKKRVVSAEKEKNEKSRLYSTLGLFGGLLAVIILI